MKYYLAIALLLLAGCAETQETIDIGLLGVVTGFGSTWGQSAVNGAQLAIDEINAQGGVNGKQLRLFVEDTKDDPKLALTGYRKLRDVNGVSYLIGPSWTSSAIALAPIASQDAVLMISPSVGVKEFNEAGDNLFNLWPHDELLSREMADIVYAEGHRYVGIVSRQHAWVETQTNAFSERFEELGGEVIVVVPGLEDRSQRAEALKLMDENVDAVMYTNAWTGDVAAKRLRELSYQGPFYSITMPQEVVTASDGAMDGMIMLDTITPTPEYFAKYQATYPGAAFDGGGDTAYDAVYLLKQAMEATQSEDPTELAAYLSRLKAYSGVSGELTFDNLGGVTKEFEKVVITNGEPITV